MTERASRPRVKPPVLLPSDALRSANTLRVEDQTPLAHLLQSNFSEHTVPRLWHRIQVQLHEPKRPWWRTPMTFAVATACLALLVLGARQLYPTDDSLRLTSGQLPAALVAEATPRKVSLADGSSIEVSQQSRLEVVNNDQATFVTALSRGSATFEVNPKARNKRRWVVEAGLTSVEVVGTRFTVTRTEQEVAVSVERGLVLVRGAAVPGGQTRLGAGQQIRTPTSLEPARPAKVRMGRLAKSQLEDLPVLEAAEPDAALESVETPKVQELEPREPLSASEQPVEPKDQAPARASKPSGKVPPKIDALLSEADRAREAGDVARALHHFEQVIATAPRFDPRRGLAAMSVARITMGSNPARAAAALRATLDGMPAALQENATARLVEAYAKSGQSKEAERTAARYLKRFPDGRRAGDVRRWASP